MHWSEWLFVVLVVLNAVMLVLEILVATITIPAAAYCLLFSVESGLALILIWGIAKYNALHDIAEKLEKQAQKQRGEVNLYEKINDEWGAMVSAAQDNLDQFAASMNLVSDDANAIDELTGALAALVERKQEIQAEERALFTMSKRYQVVRAALLTVLNFLRVHAYAAYT
jgi:predicted enzyme involved in methoxymalonyl-ACP biosynthesis